MSTLRLAPALAKLCHLPTAKPAVVANPSTGLLGDWALTLVHTRPQKLVIAVSTATRWAFALPSAPLGTLAERFGPALLQALLSLGLPPDRARAEIDRSGPFTLGRGMKPGMASYLTQYSHVTRWASGEGLGLGAINARLADHLILRPRTYIAAEEVLRLLGGNPELVQQRQQAQAEQSRASYDHAQAQIGREEVHIPVALALPGQPRLEAAYQARLVLMRLPHSDGVSGPPGLSGNPRGRWIPRCLVIDFTDVDSATPNFVRALLEEVSTLGVGSVHIANALPAVREAFEAVVGQQPAP